MEARTLNWIPDRGLPWSSRNVLHAHIRTIVDPGFNKTTIQRNLIQCRHMIGEGKVSAHGCSQVSAGARHTFEQVRVVDDQHFSLILHYPMFFKSLRICCVDRYRTLKPRNRGPIVGAYHNPMAGHLGQCKTRTHYYWRGNLCLWVMCGMSWMLAGESVSHPKSIIVAF